MPKINREKAEAIIKGGSEPAVTADNYRLSLMNTLNWYNAEYSTKDMRQWFVSFCKKAKIKIDFPITDIKDWEFRTIGMLSRMRAKEMPLAEAELARWESEFVRLRRIATIKPVMQQEDSPVPVQKPAVSIEERIENKAREFVAEFNAAVDEFLTTKKVIGVPQLVTSMQLNDKVGKVVHRLIEPTLNELRELVAGKDKQLVEGWSNLNKPEQKKLLSFYETLNEKLSGLKRIVERKPRVKKAKPASELVKKLKYAKENKDLALQSVVPTALVGATEAVLFNTKYRKLQFYKAIEGNTLTVKGSTLMNWDESASYSLTVRKPEALRDLLGKGKRAWSNYIKTLKTTQGKLSGRVNEETLILGAFN